MLKDITLGQFFPGNSFIHRLDPRTKLIMLVVYIVALFMAVLSLAKDGYLLLEKRLSAAVPEDESALWDNVEDYRYEFYCTLNPEQVISEDYVGLYEETGDRGGDTDADHDNKEGAHAQ